MKKFASIALAIIMVALCAFSFAACDSESNDNSGVSSASSAADAAKKSSNKFGVQSGTTGYCFLAGDEDWGFTGFSNINVRSYDNAGQAVADMKNGNIGYVVIDADVARSLVAATEGIKMIDIALTTESYGIAVDTNQDDLLSEINKILSEKKDDIDAIFAKYANVDENNAADWNGETIPAGKYDESADQLVVATNAAFAPFEFTSGDSFAGIDMEIAKLIAETLDKELVIVNMDFEAVTGAVGKNGIDIAITGMTINDTRKKVVNFTEPYYTQAYQVVICMKDDSTFDDCKTTEDMINVLKGLSA